MKTKMVSHSISENIHHISKCNFFVSLGLIATLQIVMHEASAHERVFSTPQGDVTVKLNLSDSQSNDGNFEDEAASFSTPEARLKVKPMEWTDAPASGGFSAAQGSLEDAEFIALPEEPAGGASGGDSSVQGLEDAQSEFADAWGDIEEKDRMEEQELKNSQGGTSQDKTSDSDFNSPISEIDASNVFEELQNFDGTHAVFTRYLGNHATQMWKYAPWRKIGKLYFTKPNGSSSYCTANLVSSKNIVATAGHCIYTRGQGWNRNFRFVPAERYGNAPYGTFSWSNATVPNGWINNGARRWDVGLVKLRNNRYNKSATYYVGWLGRSWNYGYTQHLHSLGYASNLSTQVTNICAAQSFFSGQEGTDVLVKGCDMTYGASGGGWLRNYTPYSNGGNQVNGVVSGPHIGAFGTTYVGPRFSSANIVPLCNTLGC